MLQKPTFSTTSNNPMSANAQLTTIYAAISPILIALLYWLRPKRDTHHIKGLADYIQWYNTTSTLVQAQFEPKRFNYNE